MGLRIVELHHTALKDRMKLSVVTEFIHRYLRTGLESPYAQLRDENKWSGG